MSRMKKRMNRRKQSHGEGARKKQRRKQAARALAAAGAIAGGTYAYAEPVRFDNPADGEPGHFHWANSGGFGNVLDITLPANEQPGSYASASTLAQTLGAGYSNFSSYDDGGLGVQATSLGASGSALGFESGDMIPNASGDCGFYGDPFCFSDTGYFHYPGYGYIPEGVPAYLGVTIGGSDCAYYDNCQYGWIGVVRNGAELEAFAWGYETEVGVPVEAGAGGGGPANVPAASEWGLVSMGLSLLAAGTWVFRRKLPQPRPM